MSEQLACERKECGHGDETQKKYILYFTCGIAATQMKKKLWASYGSTLRKLGGDFSTRTGRCMSQKGLQLRHRYSRMSACSNLVWLCSVKWWLAIMSPAPYLRREEGNEKWHESESFYLLSLTTCWLFLSITRVSSLLKILCSRASMLHNYRKMQGQFLTWHAVGPCGRNHHQATIGPQHWLSCT